MVDFNTLILCWRLIIQSSYIVPIKTSECYINILFIPHGKSASLVTRINTINLDYLIARKKKMKARAGSVIFTSYQPFLP